MKLKNFMPNKNLLSKYNAKRDFKKTAEPSGKLSKTKGGNSYLIQKHAATRLHYDFRLELDDVLKSWAVTKGPSLDPSDRRLAVEVEDHPVSYGTFEGIIPKGQYGGGTVMLWDQGTWEPIDDPHKGLKTGHLHFKLHGERLHGEWALVRMHSRPEDKGRNNWLLIKKDDEYAKAGDKDKLLAKENFSITTKRKMEEIAEPKKNIWQSNRTEKTSGKKESIKKTNQPAKTAAKPGLKKNSGKLPEFIEPQLATLADQMPQGTNWIHEVKFDGYRTIARLDGATQMLTRTGLDWTHKFKAIAEELKKLKVTAMFDGEIVAVDKSGRSSFMQLQKALTEERDKDLQYYIFDLLYLNGEDMRKLPLIERKEKLKNLLASKKLNGVFYSDHFTEAKGFYEKACQLGLEGVISKQADEPYHSGRGKYWLKSKCHKRQEFVIGGYTKSSTGANVIGSLLLGYYENGGFVYAGRVGTGFNHEMAASLFKKLKALKIDKMPYTKFSENGRRGGGWKRGVEWAKPQLVCEVEFTEWTDEGSLRHPSFQGLREDKPAADVKRDYELKLDDKMAPKTKPTKPKKPAGTKTVKAQTAKAGGVVEIAGIKISHPERVMYPEQGYTKEDIARYYEAVSSYMLPYIENRLISAIRCPEDIHGQCFFQRHAGLIKSNYLLGMKVKGHGDGEAYMAIDSKAGLISLAQMGIIEIHPWGSPMRDVDLPDRLIFDLDPDPEVSWKQVVESAREVKARLEKLGLKVFLKTTGGKGVHVTITFKQKYDWDVLKPWAKAIADAMVKQSPNKYTSNMSKAGRKGKIFIDYLRNGLTSTAVAAYSLRARDGATVAMPIEWKELTPSLDPKKFNIKTVPSILAKRKTDPWKDFYKPKQSITASMLKTYGINPK